MSSTRVFVCCSVTRDSLNVNPAFLTRIWRYSDSLITINVLVLIWVGFNCYSACVFGADRRANPLTSLESEGSSVDASVDASISLNVSGHVVRCGHLSGLMMRLV